MSLALIFDTISSMIVWSAFFALGFITLGALIFGVITLYTSVKNSFLIGSLVSLEIVVVSIYLLVKIIGILIEKFSF